MAVVLLAVLDIKVQKTVAIGVLMLLRMVIGTEVGQDMWVKWQYGMNIGQHQIWLH